MKKKTNKKSNQNKTNPTPISPETRRASRRPVFFLFFLLELGPLFQFVFFPDFLHRIPRPGTDRAWSKRSVAVSEPPRRHRARSLSRIRTNRIQKKNNHNQQNGANEEPSGRTQRCRRRLGAPCTSTRRRWPRRRAVRPATPPSIDGPRWPDVSLTNPVPSFLKFFFYFC